MTKKQYNVASKMVYGVLMGIMAYMAVTLAMALMQASSSTIIIQLVSIVIGMIIATIGFVTKREEKMGAILIVLGPTIAYFIMMCTNSTPITIIYAFPMMLASMVYLNARLIFVGDVVVIVGSIIHIVRLMSAGSMEADFAFVTEMIILFCIAASFLASRLLDRFNKENIAIIEEKAAAQVERAKNVTIAAENLIDSFNKADTVIGQINECINTNNFSMENIAQSTDNTANAVQIQATMCNEICHDTAVAEQEIEHMLKAADNTMNVVKEGFELIQELEKQSQVVRKASDDTVKSTNELTKKIDEVKGIVGAILSISTQTNLLALNASIEAARAGDAGRGFSVVAEEIRQLSEQTKDSVNRISEIINVLNEYADAANNSVEDTINSVEKQNEMIGSSHQKFMVISDEVGGLSELVKKTEDIMKGIFERTNVISDNISQLSATSEEVSACSTEGLTTSGEAVKRMQEFNYLLEGLYKIAKELKTSAKED